MIITDNNQFKLFPGIEIEAYDIKIGRSLKRVKSFDSETNELICYYVKDDQNGRIIKIETTEDSILTGNRKLLLTTETHNYIEIRNKKTGEILASSNPKIREQLESFKLKYKMENSNKNEVVEQPKTKLNFGQALEAVKDGKLISREG